MPAGKYPTETKHGKSGYKLPPADLRRVQTSSFDPGIKPGPAFVKGRGLSKFGPPSKNFFDRTAPIHLERWLSVTPQDFIADAVDAGYQEWEAHVDWAHLTQEEKLEWHIDGGISTDEKWPSELRRERNERVGKRKDQFRFLDPSQPPGQQPGSPLADWLKTLRVVRPLAGAAMRHPHPLVRAGGFIIGGAIGAIMWWAQGTSDTTDYIIPPGWTETCNTGVGTHWRWEAEPPQSGNPSEPPGYVGCGAQQYMENARTEMVVGYGVGLSFGVHEWFSAGHPAIGGTVLDIYQGVRNWEWLGDPAEVEMPVLRPGYASPLPLHYVENEAPWEFPIHAPIGNPAPQAWPDALPEPWEQPPGEKPAVTRPASPKPSVFPLPPFLPQMPPLVGFPPTVPGVGPVVPPEQVVEPSPGGSGVIVTQRPGRAPTNRPHRKKSEHKVTAKMKHPFVYGAVNIATEGLDFVDSIYNAIPKRYKNTKESFCAAHDYKCKFAKIWKYRDEINYAEALENYVNNQAEDMFFGMVGGQVARAQHELNPGGTGLNRATQTGQAGEAETEIEGQDQTGLLPTLTYDPVTGEWGLAWELFGLDSPDVFVPTGSPEDPNWERS